MLALSTLVSLSDLYGDSFFLFDSNSFIDNYTKLLSSFQSRYCGDVSIGYSFKTNYTSHLCRLILDLGGFAEVVSGMEYQHALNIGFPANRIIFNGPYKSTEYFYFALTNDSIVNLDNDYDLLRLSKLCRDNPSHLFNCCLRLNFPVLGVISRFGFEYGSSYFESVCNTLLNIQNLQVVGIHSHFPFRDNESFVQRSQFMAKAYSRLAALFPLKYINIGGGFMGDLPVSLSDDLGIVQTTFDDYASVVTSVLNDSFSSISGDNLPTLLLEPGTALVSNTFSFFTKIISLKSVSLSNYAFVAGSLFDISPNAKFQKLPVVHHPVSPSRLSLDPLPYDICGFTCIESDILTFGFVAPLAVNDFLEYQNVGSYSVVMRPSFILPSFPILAKCGDDYTLIRTSQSFDDVFSTFV